MAGVSRFEDLIAWQKARALTGRIYKASRLGTFARDYALAGQIQRAAVSVMANIAEGFERGRPNEFHQFLLVAKGSCGEVRSHLYVAFDAGHLTEKGFESLYEDVQELARVVAALRSSVDRKRR